jgi:hypothetical protein
LVTALILLIPLLGKHVVGSGWNWELRGFVLVGTFVFGTGLTYQLVTRNVDRIAFRVAVGVALAAALVLVWVNFLQAADDVNPAAVRYLAVPMMGIIGAALARFRPVGMAYALFAQALVLASVLIFWDPQVTSWTPAVLRGFGLNSFFVMAFIGSASLFLKAARCASSPSPTRA